VSDEHEKEDGQTLPFGTSPSARIDVLSARCRARRYYRKTGHTRPRCGYCRKTGHTRPRCPFTALSIWTNGCDHFIAVSAEQAKETADAPIDAEWLAELATPLDDWQLSTEEPLTLLVFGKSETWPQKEWIVANGAGFLASEGVLEHGQVDPMGRAGGRS
jgi:hypothetical protein